MPLKSRRGGASSGRWNWSEATGKTLLVTIADVREAARGMEGVAVRTPLVPSPALSELAGAPVYLKLENEQPSGAFKLRGAWTAIRLLPDQARSRGVITYSSGNHGQAVAFAAAQVGVRAVVVMPETAPEAKVAGVRRWGGEVEFAGVTSEDRRARALELAASEALAVIPPYDHPHIIAGQGTVGLEIMEECPEVERVAVPVGGGGLAAGVCVALAALGRRVRMFGVEPEGAATLGAAIVTGHPVRFESTASIADGLLPLSIGQLTFEHLKDRITPVAVSEQAIVEATVWLQQVQGVLAEPSGAATTAALRSGVIAGEGPLVLVVSGGNVDPGVVEELAESVR